MPRILRLFPPPHEDLPLAGAYLSAGLHRCGSPAAPFVYASFVSSLDGRIALADPATGTSRVPAALTNGNDFRLLLELEAQADCIVTHGGYMREIAAGRLDDILEIGAVPGGHDLARWRRDQGLAPQPAVVIASASLDFPIPPSLGRGGRRILVATGAKSPAEKRAAFAARGCEVIIAGSGRSVAGAALRSALGARGFRTIFLLTGPRMLETMLSDRVLSRLYLTIVHRLVGGEKIHTMLEGAELGQEGDLRMTALYFDPGAPNGIGQWFAEFEPAPNFGLSAPRGAA